MLKKLLNSDRPIFLDGAMGTMLINAGLPIGKKPELLNIENPKLIEEIHYKYLKAGADIIYTNTFGANKIKFENLPYKQFITAGIKCAQRAVLRAGKGLIALDTGSLGQLLEPMGPLTQEMAYEAYKEVVLTAKDEVDLFVIETLSDLMEAKLAILAVKENSDKPIFVTMSFDESGRTFSGCPIEAMIATLEGLGVDALGLNCSLGPNEVEPLVKKLLKYSSLPIIVKPNAGLPSLENGETTYTLTPSDFATKMAEFVERGARIVGGCCGTTDQFIAELYKKTNRFKFSTIEKNITQKVTFLTSATSFLDINEPRIVGERINPTGKPLMKKAILEQDFNFMIKQAIEQVDAGAEILDVNVGLPNTDEEGSMIETIKQVSSVVDTPLQIDSSNPKVIEAALRHYCGKPIVNSVNGDEETLNTILPLIKKYGAMVIGLTLDKNGIPKTAEDRITIAKKILSKATSLGIPKSDIIIDCLTLTAGAEQPQAQETLKALHYVKTELGLKTTLGVSNISFGLPQRKIVNKNFLLMALTQGLDLPIINPNIEENLEAIYTYRLLMNLDKNGEKYIAKYAVAPDTTVPATQNTIKEQSSKRTLEDAILKSLEAEALEETKILLKEKSGLTIIEEKIIPTLNTIGQLYETQKIFLPQLISCSQVAKSVCDLIKTTLQSTDSFKKVNVILATVQGDIHDIGKNIVKTVLQNYGYQVIDLGKDVSTEKITTILETIDTSQTMIGLSALMTTTVSNMAQTISAIKKKYPHIPIAVGGAVLTSDVATEIGADYYTKDPQAMVQLLKKLFG